jgi:hypothetical protein
MHMNKFVLLFSLFAISSCAAYKVERDGPIERVAVSEALEVKRANEWPGGKHCFEPLLYVLTVGIIPTHCVDRYTVSAGSRKIGQAKVTMMQGWVTLFMAPFPKWKYGYGVDVEPEIREIVEVAE